MTDLLGEPAERVAYIYMICHAPTARVYIGRTVNPKKRFRGHIDDLRAGKHHSRFLQRVWRKGAPCDFIFTIMEECLNSEKAGREQYWIDRIKPCFNSVPVLPDRASNYISEETRAKMRAANKGISPERRAKMVAALRARILSPEFEETRRKISRASTGRAHTPEARRKISATKKGRPVSASHLDGIKRAARGRIFTQEDRRAIGEKSRGRPVSDETRLKLSIAGKGKRRTQEQRDRISAGKKGKSFSDEHKASLCAAWVRRKARSENDEQTFFRSEFQP